ncbi:MAG TPA: hypothetical protein VNQ76_13760 [Planctomicrobium sp.]|nr:hypothetical protein [Planctomicrobium sp.]
MRLATERTQFPIATINGRHLSRRGLSLFEVVLALAIFLGATAAITQVLRTGSHASIRAQLQSQAALFCDRQMNRVLAGIEPMESVPTGSLDGHPDWKWSLNVSDGGVPWLLRLELSVEHTSSNPNAVVKSELVRLVRDPQFYVNAAESATTSSSSTEGL